MLLRRTREKGLEILLEINYREAVIDYIKFSC